MYSRITQYITSGGASAAAAASGAGKDVDDDGDVGNLFSSSLGVFKVTRFVYFSLPPSGSNGLYFKQARLMSNVETSEGDRSEISSEPEAAVAAAFLGASRTIFVALSDKVSRFTENVST